MKAKNKLFLATLTIGTAATLLIAQDRPPQPGGNRSVLPPGQGQGPAVGNNPRPAGPNSNPNSGPGANRPNSGMRGSFMANQGGRFPLPIVDALDVNRDSVIDQTEMANAAAALKKLDKNGDGKLTPQEYMPPRPGGVGGPGGQQQPPGPGPGGQQPHPGAGGQENPPPPQHPPK